VSAPFQVGPVVDMLDKIRDYKFEAKT